MKTLIISNDDKIINFFSDNLISKGYDVIEYRWLMKALDNLEEIKPEIIIVSSSEYPRHWKTLASFLQSGLSGKNVKLYLYTDKAFDSEDDKKARALGVKRIFEGFDLSSLNEEFVNLLKTKITFPVKEVSSQSSVIITDPSDNSFSYGNVENQEGNTYICSVQNSEKYISGQIIKYVSFYNEGVFTNCSAQIVGIDKVRKNLSIKIQELYEAV